MDQEKLKIELIEEFIELLDDYEIEPEEDLIEFFSKSLDIYANNIKKI